MKFRCFSLLLPLFVLFSGANSAHPQTHPQSTAAASALVSIRPTTGDQLIRQVPDNRAGVLLEFRRINTPLFGYDVSYSFRGADQLYEYRGPACTGLSCPPKAQPVNAIAHAVALNWVFSLPVANLRLFALAGGGVQRFEPESSQAGPTQGQTKALFDYGAGFDVAAFRRLGFRVQFRSNIYKAPALSTAFRSTGKLTHDSEPMAGVYFKF